MGLFNASIYFDLRHDFYHGIRYDSGSCHDVFPGYAIFMGSAEHALDVSDTTVLSDFDCSEAGTGAGTQ